MAARQENLNEVDKLLQKMGQRTTHIKLHVLINFYTLLLHSCMSLFYTLWSHTLQILLEELENKQQMRPVQAERQKSQGKSTKSW